VVYGVARKERIFRRRNPVSPARNVIDRCRLRLRETVLTDSSARCRTVRAWKQIQIESSVRIHVDMRPPGKVPAPGGIIGNKSVFRKAEPLPQAFIVGEDKYSVMLDRPTSRGTELVPFE